MHIQSFQWAIDLNADGHISLWEMWETMRWFFRIPGSLVIELVGQFPTLAQVFGVKASIATGYASLDGFYPKVISLFFWLPLLIWVLSLGSKAKPRHSYLDENPNTQPLLLPMPKDYPKFVGRH